MKKILSFIFIFLNCLYLYSGTAGSFVYNSGSQVVPHATLTLVVYDTEDYDDQGFYSAATPSRFTVSVTGNYHVACNISWENIVNNYKTIYIRKNGSTDYAVRTIAGNYLNRTGFPEPGYYLYFTVDTIIDMVSGDYVELYAYQSTGAAPINIFSTRFYIERIE
jgi:hypothetical protein